MTNYQSQYSHAHAKTFCERSAKHNHHNNCHKNCHNNHHNNCDQSDRQVQVLRPLGFPQTQFTGAIVMDSILNFNSRFDSPFIIETFLQNWWTDVWLQRWSIFRAMRCRWFIFQQRCDTDYFLERLNIAIVAIIFLDHWERFFFDYFAHFEDRLFCDYSRYARSGQKEKNLH